MKIISPEKLAEEIGAQPMVKVRFTLGLEYSKKELEEAGYKPVSSMGLIWIKDSDE